MTGSAEIQSGLWSERSSDWAEVMEGWTGWRISRGRTNPSTS